MNNVTTMIEDIKGYSNEKKPLTLFDLKWNVEAIKAMDRVRDHITEKIYWEKLAIDIYVGALRGVHHISYPVARGLGQRYLLERIEAYAGNTKTYKVIADGFDSTKYDNVWVFTNRISGKD